MCGRYVLEVDPDQLQLAFHLSDAPTLPPRYNVAPTQFLPVITNEQPDALSFLRWGLIPSWAKDMSIGNKLINARAETAAEKPSFRSALKRRRCLVPASGFYEWQKQTSGKTPLYIQVKDAPVIAFAGLWEIWHSPDGSELRTYTILTTGANEFMQPIHTRMPVILHPRDYDQWLDPREVPGEQFAPLLQPFEADRMTAYEVSKAVNSPSFDSPELIRPVA